MPNATQTTVTGLQWFKIYEDGLTPSTQAWAVDRLIANKGKVTFQIPSCIQPGQYLLRHEIIGERFRLTSFFYIHLSKSHPRKYADVMIFFAALHAANSYPGAQFYMECAQLQITGGGSAQPATVSFPGAYKGTDPGIKINIYQTLSNYTIPGKSVSVECMYSGSLAYRAFGFHLLNAVRGHRFGDTCTCFATNADLAPYTNMLPFSKCIYYTSIRIFLLH